MVSPNKMFPILKVEKGCIVSMQGDFSVVYRATLPEIFTLSDGDYEAYHQVLVKAIKVLPKHSVFHKMDWFVRDGYRADYGRAGDSFLARSSETFFNERERLEHSCYVILTKKPEGRKLSSSVYSNVLRRSIVPAQLMEEKLQLDFLDSCGQLERILKDSGFVALSRLGDDELAGTANNAGLIERFTFLLGEHEPSLLRDISVRDGLKVGEKEVELYRLSEMEDLPALCGSRINYDRYSTDRSKFSIGFVSPLGQLLDCNHIYNQYIFIGDDRDTIKRLEAKKLRLQSLSGYSRENAVSRDAVNDFLNEAVVHQRLPIKAHFNVLAWSDDPMEMRDLKNKVSSAMAQLDAVAKLETEGAAQIWFA